MLIKHLNTTGKLTCLTFFQNTIKNVLHIFLAYCVVVLGVNILFVITQ